MQYILLVTKCYLLTSSGDLKWWKLDNDKFPSIVKVAKCLSRILTTIFFTESVLPILET